MIAIYARQSVDKKDSISIDTQIETCKRKLGGGIEEIVVFEDKGFSGKSTDRPAFKEMMEAVRSNRISKLIVYKLDRISRSLIDFITMRQEFTKYGVDFVSCAEDFDTSTSTGKLMLNMLMMFAEMERETIQKRIKDNYYARGEKGLYLGGRSAYGYDKVDTIVNGKKTCMHKENTVQAAIMKQMYVDYSNGVSTKAIARGLNYLKIESSRKKGWDASVVSKMLKNPVYVKANAEVYNYLVSKEATMNNSVDEYIGENGCLVYGDISKASKSKFVGYKGYFVTVGLHKGFIEPSLWLKVQYMFDSKYRHSNIGTGVTTWLQGLIKCKCGLTYNINKKVCKGKVYRYLFCRGRTVGKCHEPKLVFNLDKLEDVVEKNLLEKMERLKQFKSTQLITDTPEVNALKIRVAETESKINDLVEQMVEGSSITIQYLNQALESLHEKKRQFLTEISSIELKRNMKRDSKINFEEVLERWNEYDLEAKKHATKEMVEKITIEGEEISIIYY